MRHLLKVTLGIVSILSVLITFARVVKGTDDIVDFSFRDQSGSFCHKPCLLEVYHDQPVNAALDEISNYLSTKGVIPFQNSYTPVGYPTRLGTVYLTRNPNTTNVASITIAFNHAAFSQPVIFSNVYPMRLGDIFTILGKPGFVGFDTTATGETFCTALYYVFENSLYLKADVPHADRNSCFSVSTNVAALELVPISFIPNAAPWSGFASGSHYKTSHQPINPASEITIWQDNRK